MKTVLLFKTASPARVLEVLRGAARDWEYYLVEPEGNGSLADSLQQLGFQQFHILPAGRPFIDYKELTSSRRIPQIYYDEVWVISGFSENYDSFGEVYAVLTHVRYGTMCWFGTNAKFLQRNNTPLRRGMEKALSFFAWAIFCAAKRGCGLRSKMKGYQW